MNAFQLQLFEKEISLYQTEGEYHVYNFDEIIYQRMQKSLEQYRCESFPKVQFAQVVNYYQEIHKIQGKQFKSISSNNTHFATLSKDNEVSVYEWKNQIIQQVGESIKIQFLYKCFSINLSIEFAILLDCYKENQLHIMQIIDVQSRSVYQTQSQVPFSTKMQVIVNGTNTFIIYAQHFSKFSILSLLSAQFQNLSCWNNEFIDFDTPIKNYPNIYILNSHQVLQFSISTESTFQLQSTFKLVYKTLQAIINVYYSYQTYSQCDSILVQQLEYQSYRPDLIQLWGCENQIINWKELVPYQSMLILQNNQFIIQYAEDEIRISSQQSQSFEYQLNSQNNSQLYFNSDNELFSFNQEIIVYKISYPSLSINLTNQENAGYTSKFSILCQPIQLNFLQYEQKYLLNITLQVLFQNDTNIYVMFNQDFQQYNYTWKSYVIKQFDSFSGQLLNYKLNQDLSLLNSKQITFNKAFKINQTFQLAQILQINQKFNKIKYFFIGYNNQSLDLFNCDFIYYYQKTSKSCMKLSSINISINGYALKVASSIYPEVIIIGLSDQDTIYLFKQNYVHNNEYSQSSFKFEIEFSDFIITYMNIIVLIKNREIQIMTLDFTNNFILNQEQICKLFTNDKIQFKPVQIIMNTQLSSSLLYINNINEIIVISIQQNNLLIPIQLIQVDFKMIQINLVNVHLIVSYSCDNYHICFQVWNIEYLPQYYYEKSLQKVKFDNEINIQSNNLFFFVTFSNYTVQVYNPSLPEHMSLYYILELKSPIQCSHALQVSDSFLFSKSILFYQNVFKILDKIQTYNISIQYYNTQFNNSKIYPEVIYNFTVSTQLNQSAFQLTPNQSMTIYSNFTIFQTQYNQTINLTLENINFQTKSFTYPIKLLFDRQISQCEINYQLKEFHSSTKYCRLAQSVFLKNESANIENFTLITQINNQLFALQNNQYIYIVNIDFQILSNLSYSNFNFTTCLQSTSNSQNLYSICQNVSSSYWLAFLLSDDYGTNLELIKVQELNKTFLLIYKIINILDLNFILGVDEDFQYSQLYLFTYSNGLEYSIFNYDCTDFSVAQLENSINNNQTTSIIVFYFQYEMICYQQIKIEGNNILLISDPICNYLSLFYKNIDGNQYFSVVYIQILQTFYDNVVILISLNTVKNENQEFKSYLSYIINVHIIPYTPTSTFIFNIIKTIPNYGNLINFGQSIYYNGILMQKFKQENNYTVAIYQLNNLLEQDLSQPLLMQGSFKISSPKCAIIINQTQINGICLSSFWNNSKQNFSYAISSQDVTCHIRRKKKEIKLPIFCSNLFSNGTYEITFNLPQLNYSNRGWIYGLLSIISLLLLYFFIKVKYKIKNMRNVNPVIEL